MIPSNWLDNPDYPKVLVAVLEYYTNALNTMYLSTHPLVATYNGSLTGFNPRLVGDASFSVGLVDSSSGMRTTSNFGLLNLLNSDGKLDNWLSYGVDGRPIKMYLLPLGSSNIDTDGIQIFHGTVDKLEIPNNNTLAIVFKDPLLLLDFPLDETNYAVGEVISYTILGSPKTLTVTDELKDKSKPICLGTVFSIEPVLLASATKTYQIDYQGIEEIVAVYDRGVLLTPGIGYNVDLSKGILELVANNAGTITCDVKGRKINAGVFSDYASDIIKHIISVKSVDTSYVTPNYVKLGVYMSDRTNILDLLDQIVGSYDGYFGFDYVGNFIQGNLTIPNTKEPSELSYGNFSKFGDLFYDNSGTYVLASDILGTANYSTGIQGIIPYALVTKLNTDIVKIDESDIIGDIALATANDITFSSKVKYKKNYTVQTDIAYSVADAQKEFLASEFREVVLTDPSVQIKHLRAVESVIESSLLLEEVAAKQLANRILRKNSQQMFELRAKVAISKMLTKSVGSVLDISDYRYGLSQGTLAVVREITLNYLAGTSDVIALLTRYPNQLGTFSYYTGSFYPIPASIDAFIPATHNDGIRYLQLDNILAYYVPTYLTISEKGNPQPTDPVISIRKVVGVINHITIGGASEIAINDSIKAELEINLKARKVAVYHNGIRLGVLDIPTGDIVIKVNNTSTIPFKVYLPTDKLYWGELEKKRGFVY